jgi:aminoglycoside phosphotransferase family enzyme
MREPNRDGTRWDSLPALERKVAFLEKPESYPEPTTRVEVIETHMSWVFLTDETVYKLKKPARLALVDLVSLESRRRNSEAEVRWNRRLAPEVYLGVVPLALDADGRLVLGGAGTVVDWLVKMRRLPAPKMLDREISTGEVTPRDVRRLAERLADFYRAAPRIEIGADSYLRRFRDDVRDVEDELRQLSTIPSRRVKRISNGLWSFLDRWARLLEERVEQGRIVEGHGDLRPEHVCLLERPVVIDCVEFSRELRTVDPLDELGFLAIECKLMGGPAFIEEILFETYRRATDDRPSGELVGFYELYRSFLRAKTTIWHLRDETVRDREKWIERTERYVTLAERLLDGGPSGPRGLPNDPISGPRPGARDRPRREAE